MSRSQVQWLKQQPPMGMLKSWPISPGAARRQRRQRAACLRTGPPKPATPRITRYSTSCPRGHVVADDTVQWIHRNGRSYRVCRECRNKYQRDWRRRSRAQARLKRLEAG